MAHKPQTLHPAHAQQHPALTGATVAVISGENGKFISPDSKQGHEALAQDLDQLGLDYEPTRGQYFGTPERSYIILNPTMEQAIDLGRRYGQEAVVFSQGGRHQYVYTNGDFGKPGQELATPPTPGKAEKYLWYDRQPNDNYTVVPGPNGEPYGWFKYNLDFDNDKVPARQPAKVVPLQRSEDVRDLALRVLREGVIDTWHEALLELRMRELAKSNPGDKQMSNPLAKTSVPGGLNVAQHHGARYPASAPPRPDIGRPKPKPKPTPEPQEPVKKGELEPSLCKCGGAINPVVKAMTKGECCAKCAKSSLDKGETPAWSLKGKQVGSSKDDAGSGGKLQKTGSCGCGKPGCKTCKLGKAMTSMSTPSAPKPPQAPGAAPTAAAGTMKKGEATIALRKALGDAGGMGSARGTAKPNSATAAAAKTPAPAAVAAAGFRPASPGAAGAPMKPPATPGSSIRPPATGVKPLAVPKPKPTPLAGLKGILGFKKPGLA